MITLKNKKQKVEDLESKAADVKFSQFSSGGNIQSGDTLVGLRSGVNTKFNAPTAGVSSLNSLIGDLSITSSGGGLTITPSGKTIDINPTGTGPTIGYASVIGRQSTRPAMSFTTTGTYQIINVPLFLDNTGNNIVAGHDTYGTYLQNIGASECRITFIVILYMARFSNSTVNNYYLSPFMSADGISAPIIYSSANIAPFSLNTQASGGSNNGLVPISYTTIIDFGVSAKVYLGIANNGSTTSSNNDLTIDTGIFLGQKIGDVGGSVAGVSSLNTLEGDIDVISPRGSLTINTSGNNINADITSPVSIANGGTNTDASSFASNQVIFQNSGNTAFSSSSNLTYSGGNLSLIGGAFAGASADGDKLLLLGSSTSAKISHSSGWSFNYYAGNTANTSTGLYTWNTVNASGAFQQVMSLSNIGVLNLPNLTANLPIFTDASKNLTNSGIIPIANGGTNTNSQSTNGIIFFDGTSVKSNSNFSYDGLSNVNLSNPTGSAYFNLIRQNSSQNAQLFFQDIGGTNSWTMGIISADNFFHFITPTPGVQVTINPGGGIASSAFTASSLLATDSTKTLTSLPSGTSGQLLTSAGSGSVPAWSSGLSWNGLGLTISGASNPSFMNIGTTLSGTANQALFQLARGDQTNGTAIIRYQTNPSTIDWQIGTFSGSNLYQIKDGLSNLRLSLDASGNFNLPSLSASQIVLTDASKNLISGGAIAANAMMFGNTGGTGYSTITDLTYTASTANLLLSTAIAAPTIKIATTLTGSTNSANFILSRGDTSFGAASINFDNGSTTIWGLQMFSAASAMSSNVNDLIFRAAAGGGGVGNILILGQNSGDVTAGAGNFIVNIAGKTLKIKQGTNACSGTGVTLSSGTATISTTAVATGDTILITKTANGGTTTTGMPAYSITNGVSFTLTGSSLDTSTYNWVIIKAA